MASASQAQLASLFSELETCFRSGFNNDDDDGTLVVLNNLSYCGFHARDICRDCSRDYAYGNEQFGSGFELPENGVPEYPHLLNLIRDPIKRHYVGQRWLELQKALCSFGSKERLIKFPVRESPDEGTLVDLALHKKLQRVFHQLQALTSSQRYYLGNLSRIMIQDYDTFMEAAVRYEEEINDMTARRDQLFELRGMVAGAKENQDLARANILSKFGFLLELNTLRTFWRTMEMTADAFTMHTENYDEEADGHVVFTEKAKVYLLQWLSNILWSAQHAQFRLNFLRGLQHEVYQRGQFPFYPVYMAALKADRDVHLIIAKLSKASLLDLPGFASLLVQLREASEFHEQMAGVNAELMAAIDELSARFRVLEKGMSVALLVASEEEIKAALMTYKFDSNGREINSKVDDVAAVVTKVHEGDSRPGTRKKCSYLQKLIVKENTYRQTHAVRFMRPPFTKMTGNQFTRKMFDEFKSIYSFLYLDNTRKLWKEDEYSLLPMDVAGRCQHRLDVQKKKKKKKPISAANYEQADVAEARSVPDSAFTDSSLLWEVGDGTTEKYVPPVVREKVKTRKQVMNSEESAGQKADDSTVEKNGISSTAAAQQEAGLAVRRSLDQLKKSDVVTRDLLWRKVKGVLKWSDLVQFLTRLGCHLLPQDGSKKKIVDPSTGRWTLLHRPHPGDECRPDQRESYRIHIEDWLDIKFSDLEALDEVWKTK